MILYVVDLCLASKYHMLARMPSFLISLDNSPPNVMVVICVNIIVAVLQTQSIIL